MRRTLLVTNDFPPRTGGIQSYLYELAGGLPCDDLVVYAPAWPGAAEFDAAQPFAVVRHPSSLMLPVPSVRRRAAQLMKRHRLSGVWFGAAAPLALLAPGLRRSGAVRVVASTHGHEVGWSMVPGARQALRRIGTTVDAVTFVSEYSRRRIASALGPAAALEYLPPGVDTTIFRPDDTARRQVRSRLGLADRPVLLCLSRLVPRKGQDMLIRALPAIRAAVPQVSLLLVGGGRDEDRLRRLALSHGVADAVTMVGPVALDELAAYYAAGDVFAMPCRTRGGGLDVEGLGIVFLEASAAGLPVIAGDSGGAPETVQPGATGLIVPGRNPEAIASAAITLLLDARMRSRWGRAGREWVRRRWNWQTSADRLATLLDG